MRSFRGKFSLETGLGASWKSGAGHDEHFPNFCAELRGSIENSVSEWHVLIFSVCSGYAVFVRKSIAIVAVSAPHDLVLRCRRRLPQGHTHTFVHVGRYPATTGIDCCKGAAAFIAASGGGQGRPTNKNRRRFNRRSFGNWVAWLARFTQDLVEVLVY